MNHFAERQKEYRFEFEEWQNWQLKKKCQPGISMSQEHSDLCVALALGVSLCRSFLS